MVDDDLDDNLDLDMKSSEWVLLLAIIYRKLFITGEAKTVLGMYTLTDLHNVEYL